MAKVKAKTTASAAMQECIDAMQKKLEAAMEIIAESCADHCPHHRAPAACRNCSIGKRIEENGLNNTAQGA